MPSIQLPSIVRKFDLVVNGYGNAGKADEIVLPKQVPIKVGYKAGGLNAELKVPMGYEPMETSFSLTGLSDAILTSDGICTLDGTRLQFKGYEKSLANCDSSTVQIFMRGNLKDWDPGTIKKGEMNTTKIALDLTYFHYMRDGVSLIERDDLNGTYLINGVDIYQDGNSAIN